MGASEGLCPPPPLGGATLVGAAMWLPPLHSERSHLRREPQGAPPWHLTHVALLPAGLTAWAEARSSALSLEEKAARLTEAEFGPRSLRGRRPGLSLAAQATLMKARRGGS